MANIITIDYAKILIARAHTISHAFIIVLACIFATTFLPTTKAIAQTKTLKLYYLHTREKNTITYYKNGKYINSALKKINWALRDWRRNEPTKMDPKLLDLVWEAYRRSGSKAYIHVISGYRSPITNNNLRKRGRGVAKNSQHTRGKALDFFLPDVKISKMRSIGLKMGIGGVGYYPRSGSPFVHLDTGNVRHWPRMTRTQLAKVFPNGKTMHIPTDGKPLAKYKVAVAEYKRRVKKGGKNPTTTSSKKELNFFQRLAARVSADEKDDAAQSTPILPRAVKTIKAPVPTPAPTIVKPIIGTSGGPAEIEIAGPLSITKPAPLPELPPEIPEEPKREFAILAERRVPFPVASPRKPFAPTSNPEDNTIIEPQVAPSEEQIVVAVLTPEKQILTVPTVSTVPKLKLKILEPIEVPQAQIEAADLATTQDFTIPPPIKRPQFKNEPEVQLASLETVEKAPAKVERTRPQQVSTTLNLPALTANEIEDMRRSATPKLKTSLESQKVPIVVATKTKEKVSSENQLALADENLRSTNDVITNKAIAAIEDVTNENGLVENNAPKPKLEQEVEIVIALNNIPIPTRNPRFIKEITELPDSAAKVIVSANLDSENFAVEIKSTLSNSGLGERTVSLDKFSAPQENKNSIGQYALANTFSIRDLNAVKAPAYERNIIRKTPSAVFVDGFRSNVNQSTNYGFSGKAIVFKKFARLTK